jgi:hypothetical protein
LATNFGKKPNAFRLLVSIVPTDRISTLLAKVTNVKGLKSYFDVEVKL